MNKVLEIRVAPSNLGSKSVLGSSVISSGFSKNSEWDIYNTKEQYIGKLGQIESWNISEKDRERILNFLRRIELEGVGVVQRLKYIYGLQTLFKAVNKDLDDFIESDIEDFLLSMGNYTLKTKETRWCCVRKFLKYIGMDHLTGEIKPSFRDKGMKLPEELLSEEDVKAMVNVAFNIRDKAFISLLYETGCRIGEMLSRHIKHIAFDEYGGILTIDGKTGMRRVRIIQSVPYLANWIEHHPRKDDPEAFLWINLNNYRTQVGHAIIYRNLKEIAVRAGIKKKIYPHLFRHSRATHLANDLTEQQLKIYFGWAGDSRMASIYVHLSGKDVDNAILQLNGLKPREKKEENSIKTCARCGNMNSSFAKYCNKCGMVLDESEAFKIKDINPEDDFKDFMQVMYKKWKQDKASKD